MSKEKKKILYLVEAMGGGVVTYIETLANGLKDEFDFVIAYGIRNQTPEDLDAHFDEGIKLVEVKNFTRPVHPVKDFLSYKEIKKIITQTIKSQLKNSNNTSEESKEASEKSNLTFTFGQKMKKEPLDSKRKKNFC